MYGLIAAIIAGSAVFYRFFLWNEGTAAILISALIFIVIFSVTVVIYLVMENSLKHKIIVLFILLSIIVCGLVFGGDIDRATEYVGFRFEKDRLGKIVTLLESHNEIKDFDVDDNFESPDENRNLPADSLTSDYKMLLELMNDLGIKEIKRKEQTHGIYLVTYRYHCFTRGVYYMPETETINTDSLFGIGLPKTKHMRMIEPHWYYAFVDCLD